MRKVFIIYSSFYTNDGANISIGGIQTYIKMLCEVVKKCDLIPVIYQFADIEFYKIYNEIEVYGIPIKKSWSKRKKNKVIFNACMKQFKMEDDIIIFATDLMVIKNNINRVISIQHGLTCDIKKHEEYSHYKNILYGLLRTCNAYKTVLRANRVNTIVAVDYNFLNWYRTKVAHIETNVKVIPNCTKIEKLKKEKTNIINIIFARRFHEYRGTKLFASVLKRILDIYDNVYATFAGSGPDETYLRNMFYNNSKVKFIKYKSEDSYEIHKNYQIAVIPTIGSEGTSLSLLEAMAAQCAVIATNVGGMTNIILDHYNGLMINPDENELYNAIEKLIVNNDLREKLSKNAYNTVSQAFNKNLWEKRWIKVLEEVSK